MALLLLCTSTVSIEFRFCPHCHLADIPLQPLLIGLASASARAISSVTTEWILKEHRTIHLSQQMLWINLYSRIQSISWIVGLWWFLLFDCHYLRCESSPKSWPIQIGMCIPSHYWYRKWSGDSPLHMCWNIQIPSRDPSSIVVRLLSQLSSFQLCSIK